MIKKKLKKKKLKNKQLHFACNKCGHHLFTDEVPGWVNKIIKPCPNCGEETDGHWDGNFALVGYGNYEEFISDDDEE